MSDWGRCCFSHDPQEGLTEDTVFLLGACAMGESRLALSQTRVCHAAPALIPWVSGLSYIALPF